MTHSRSNAIVIATLLSIICLQLAPPGALAQEHQAEPVMLTEGTVLRVVTAQEISSKTANAGDTVNFTVDEDVVVGGQVVIKKGTSATGSVINAEPSGRMGKSGKLGITVETTNTLDGQPVKVRAAKGKEGNDKTNSTAALAMLASSLFLLKKGGDAKIPAGSPVTVYIAEERRFRVDGSTLIADNPPPTPVDPDAPDNQSIVYIYRPSKMVGGALEPSVFADKAELARMDNGRYLTLKLKPGKHVIQMTDDKKAFAIDMGPGQTYYFRVGIEMGMWKGHGKLTLEDAEKAVPEIKKLKYLGKDKIKDHTMVVEIDPKGTESPKQP